MNIYITSSIAVFIFFSLLSPVYGYQCTVYDDVNNQFSLGSALLGDSPNKVKGPVVKSKNCFISADKQYMDCEIIDTNSVSYLIEGQKIIRKEISASQKKVEQRLPFGISMQDRLVDVILKLKNTRKMIGSWHLNYDDDEQLILSTDFCTRNSNSNLYDTYIVFGTDFKITTFGQRVNW